jgi:DNA-binding NtrC family response regulator
VQEAEPPSFIPDSTPSSENGVPANLQAGAPIQGSEGSGLAKVNEDRKRAETEVIIQALNSTLWNRKRAAALLGTDYKALLYKMKKLGIG